MGGEEGGGGGGVGGGGGGAGAVAEVAESRIEEGRAGSTQGARAGIETETERGV